MGITVSRSPARSGSAGSWRTSPRSDENHRAAGLGSVSRGQLEDFIRAVRLAAQDTDAEYQALLARRREYALRESQAQRERQAGPARRARLGEDQARIDAVLAQTEQ
jgi:hypothetical protein